MIDEATRDVTGGSDLDRGRMTGVFEEIMTGACSTGQIAAFLRALAAKGETVEEITAAAEVMRSHAVKIRAASKAVLDTCGTGGDRKNTFNISTTAAFVLAGCGVTIAKHGNRSVSSACGSADILEALGVVISLDKDSVEKCLDEVGIAFLYAPDFHPAMKFAAPARKEIAGRTIFNILGPLCNPAGATHQLIGVYSRGIGPVLAEVCGKLGVKHCLCVHGEGVFDEVTTTGWTELNELNAGAVKTFKITPEEFGLTRAGFSDLSGGDPLFNAGILVSLLNGACGPKRDIVIFNSAAALYAADKVGSIKEGMAVAERSIDSGNALRKLEQLREFTRLHKKR